MKYVAILFLFVASQVNAQTLTGHFKGLKSCEIVLKGFDGFEEIDLATSTSDSLGNFSFKYPITYIGAALIQPKGAPSLIVLLNNENFSMQWDDLQDFKTLQFQNSPENEAFTHVIALTQETEPKLVGLKYLLDQYKNHTNEYKWIAQEIAHQESKFPNFLQTLPTSSYAVNYLKVRKLIMDFPQTANRYIDRRTQNEIDFKAINFNESRLWTSGLLAELLDGFYQLMETYVEIPEIVSHCNSATDSWMKSLSTNPTRQQVVAEHCFKWLEKRSLFGAAEYLAKAMLNQTDCKLAESNIHLFEQYRKMGIGNLAPDIIFEAKNTNQKNQNLKSINSAFKLVVFGASWCPNCQTEYPTLVNKYKNLKEKFDLEVVYISIDTDKKVVDNYYKEAPFSVFCDTQGWNTRAVKDYHVFATPTYILLNKDLKIVAKIQSPEHLEAWLDANKLATATK